MKKLTFKVTSPKNDSIVSLIKDINQVSCRIFLDLENGFVSVENISDSMIDVVIDIINTYYTILNVSIDSTLEESQAQLDTGIVSKSVANAIEKQPTFLEPQSADDLIIQKVKFENKYIENLINKFIKTAYWALYNKQATEKEIGDFILTTMSEISMQYSSNSAIEFSVGDIVDVNFGSHLSGEIVGRHVNAIVCDVLNEKMAYVIPITKEISNISSTSYLFINSPTDVTYYNDIYKYGTALVDKGKYIRVERFNSVVGKTKALFFKKLLHKLASTFDFTHVLVETVEKDDNSPLTEKVVTSSISNIAENTFEAKTSSNEATIQTETLKKVSTEETALLEVIGFAFDKLYSYKSVQEQVEPFLTDIGMISTEKLITQSFIVACDIKKIKYENVVLRLCDLFPEENEEKIKATLKKAFKNWLEKYPILAEKCPKISFMAILKLFAKKLS